jgi:hypothetical protein
MDATDKSDLQRMRQIGRSAMFERALLPDFSATALRRLQAALTPDSDQPTPGFTHSRTQASRNP